MGKKTLASQEGALAQELHFQSRTGAVHIKELISPLMRFKNSANPSIPLVKFCVALHSHRVLVALGDNSSPSEAGFKYQKNVLLRNVLLHR